MNPRKRKGVVDLPKIDLFEPNDSVDNAASSSAANDSEIKTLIEKKVVPAASQVKEKPAAQKYYYDPASPRANQERLEQYKLHQAHIKEKLKSNIIATAALGGADSADIGVIFSTFLKETAHQFLEAGAKYFLFPFAALMSIGLSILAWRQAYLDRTKKDHVRPQNVAKATLETFAATVVTAAVIFGLVMGALGAVGIAAIMAPILFTAILGIKTIYHFVTSLVAVGKYVSAKNEVKQANANIDELVAQINLLNKKIDKLQKKMYYEKETVDSTKIEADIAALKNEKKRIEPILDEAKARRDLYQLKANKHAGAAKSNAISTFAGVLATIGVAVVMIFGKVAAAVLGVVAGITGVIYAAKTIHAHVKKTNEQPKPDLGNDYKKDDGDPGPGPSNDKRPKPDFGSSATITKKTQEEKKKRESIELDESDDSRKSFGSEGSSNALIRKPKASSVKKELSSSNTWIFYSDSREPNATSTKKEETTSSLRMRGGNQK